MLPESSERVERQSPKGANRRIEKRSRERVRAAAASKTESARLRELDREWDVERTLEANAATIALIGVALSAFVSKRFLIIPAVVTGFLLQHALQGWCPPLPVFRRLGVRTTDEIDRERIALKALRGDFNELQSADADVRSDAAWTAAKLH